MKEPKLLSLEYHQEEREMQVAFAEKMGMYNGWIGFSIGFMAGAVAMVVMLYTFGVLKPL